MKSTDEQNTNPDIYLAAVEQNGGALRYVPEELRDEKLCLAAVQQFGLALEYVPEELRDEKMCMAAVKQYVWALQYVPENVQLANPDICMATIAQNGLALRYVPEAVQLANPDILLAAVRKHWLALQYVPKSLKTNAEALAKLYTTSEEQLRDDLLSLEINDDVINQVICSLKAPIAKSSSMMEQLLGTGNDSKQPAEHHVNSRDVIPAALLLMIEGYVYTPSNQENDAKESKGLSPL